MNYFAILKKGIVYQITLVPPSTNQKSSGNAVQFLVMLNFSSRSCHCTGLLQLILKFIFSLHSVMQIAVNFLSMIMNNSNFKMSDFFIYYLMQNRTHLLSYFLVRVTQNTLYSELSDSGNWNTDLKF